jgi:hypothetical protein
VVDAANRRDTEKHICMAVENAIAAAGDSAVIRGRGRKVDANQPAIVAELRRRGCSVQSLTEVGHGCPDILVGHARSCFLFEIKDPGKPLSKRKLTDDEVEWHVGWNGQVNVIETADEAWAIVKGSLA